MWLLVTSLLTLAASDSSLPLCALCQLGISGLNAGLSDPWVSSTLDSLGVEACSTEYPYAACSVFGKTLTNIALTSFAQHYLSPEFTCSVLSLCESPIYIQQNWTDWLEVLYQTQPIQFSAPSPSGKVIKVAQVTDPHIDFFYEPGTSTQCGDAICCQTRFGNSTPVAGLWGDFNCDLPILTFESALESLAEQDLDFLIYTGDSASHDIWNQTEALKVESVEQVSMLLGMRFAVPVYPILGNNDGSPSEQFSFQNSSWLTVPASSYWTSWLTPEALESFQQTGGYSQLHLNTSLRIIAINTLACKNLNLYLLSNVTDPGGQILFLQQELAKTEANGERAFILGHIPPGSEDCLSTWAAHYNAVVARFKNVVAGQFFGHTHSDQFYISTDPMSGNPATVQWVAPSLTTLADRNPSYRVYLVDSGNYEVLDYIQYRFDLTSANEYNVSTWEEVYSFQEEYGLGNLTLETMTNLATLLTQDSELALRYLDNYYTGGPESPITCGNACLESLNCALTNAIWKETLNCLNSSLSGEEQLLELIQGPWTYLLPS